MKTIKCDHCGEEITGSYISVHIVRLTDLEKEWTHEPYELEFCNLSCNFQQLKKTLPSRLTS